MKGGFGRISSRSFKQVQRSTGIRVEVIEDDLGCAVVRRLCCGVNNYVWLGFLQEPKNPSRLRMSRLDGARTLGSHRSAARRDHDVSPSGPKNTAR